MNLRNIKIIGLKKLKIRADKIRSNKSFAEKIASILKDQTDEKEQINHKKMYTTRKVCILNLLNEDNKIMNDFHNANWEAKLSVIDKFSDERLKYFGKKLIYEENHRFII